MVMRSSRADISEPKSEPYERKVNLIIVLPVIERSDENVKT